MGPDVAKCDVAHEALRTHFDRTSMKRPGGPSENRHSLHRRGRYYVAVGSVAGSTRYPDQITVDERKESSFGVVPARPIHAKLP